MTIGIKKVATFIAVAFLVIPIFVLTAIACIGALLERIGYSLAWVAERAHRPFAAAGKFLLAWRGGT